MLSVIVNAACVIVGSTIGILFNRGISENLTNAIMKVMGLCTVLIGVQMAIKTENVLCVIICLVLGTVIGELLNIDKGINTLGDTIKAKVSVSKGESSRFTEGFVTSCIVFCVGSMTIVGSLEAGINHDYSILFAKSVMDFITSIVFASAMGIGVAFSGVFILVFQGGICLLATALSSVLTDAVVLEMSAVGGVILIGMAINILDLNRGDQYIKVANMIPAILLPILYLAVAGIF